MLGVFRPELVCTPAVKQVEDFLWEIARAGVVRIDPRTFHRAAQRFRNAGNAGMFLREFRAPLSCRNLPANSRYRGRLSATSTPQD
jgi:hypothetical protein